VKKKILNHLSQPHHLSRHLPTHSSNLLLILSGNIGTGAFLKNFFSEIWQNIQYVFSEKRKVGDIEFFDGSIGEQKLIDYYAFILESESFCQKQLRDLYINLKDDGSKPRKDIAYKTRNAYFQCKLLYNKQHSMDPNHILKNKDFVESNIYVFKQPYYLISNINKNERKKLNRLFLSEPTLEYLLYDDIIIPECFGRCKAEHFNKVVFIGKDVEKRDVFINNNMIPPNLKPLKTKNMIIYVNVAYVHNLNTDYFTKENITKEEIIDNNVRVCMGYGTYYNKNILSEKHFELTYVPFYDFPKDNNFHVFLKKNIHMVPNDTNHICYINYDLQVTDIEINDPYGEITADLMKSLYVLKNM
ncbi:high molecular weight rhoptry protein 2, partial [Hepatocystis sp. ex Piliocolobus tephrosceles]